MTRLLDRVGSVETLQDAWRQVLANDLDDGEMSASGARFAEDLDRRLEYLSSRLREGQYQPDRLTPVQMVLGAKRRELHIPTVADRVVARAVLTVIGPLVDTQLGSAAFAYRPGLGVVDAVQEVTALREEGLSVVLRTDIKDCFPSLPKEMAVRRMRHLVDDQELNDLVERLTNRVYRAPTGGLRTLAGVPQGCPLSPVLANLVLVEVDEELQGAGFPVVRYGDDLLIAAPDVDAARTAGAGVATALRRLGMELNQSKTKVTSFAEGFTFLGEDFGPRYPPHLEDHRVTDPDARILYVARQGARVRMSAGRILVESSGDADLLSLPSSQVERIVLFGSVGLSAGVRSWALATGVDVIFASRKGNYLGTQLSHEHRLRPARLRAQLAFSESERSAGVARAIVTAKITKQRVVLQRFNRRESSDVVSEAVRHLDGLLALLPDANRPAEAMGMEGAAARAYFPALGELLPEELRFKQRSRQPPQDLANAALSFLYTVLLGECVTALHTAGLDPTFGILHTEQRNRPSLALDLIEEFRPWVVDQVVVEACRRSRLKSEHARREPNRGVLLTKKGKSIVIDAYERRMLTQVSGAIAGFKGTRRRHLYRQAQCLRAVIMDPGQTWSGVSWRP
ncbi:MAG: CRISPR-associated endonuclease Cas1 [Propioniciclava sp.]